MREVREVGGSAALVHSAVRGSAQAWEELVDRNGPVVWGVARAYCSNHTDAEDVYQATWLLLAENLERLRSPDALSGWLVTTARRESARLARARQREAPTGVDPALFDVPDHDDGPESKALRSITAARLWQAFGQLSQRCQQLLRVLAVAPETSYAQVSEALGMARGTIGPKRSRCLALLRQRMTSLGGAEEAA
ncbi:sigma-70 family RNA polymerase sigma factor [Saccharopolyspora erythraea]|uniref:RNA polymerase sigma factor n=1 Tax=Saccharopolyspora erythraea TaxID=1836 RepID=UPI001BA75957|nr:sigma-70 family RNA polymerase sigma factor [Saccharopolyspora erythraea]QUH05338.1 sigma-70 family RNA polymerase sigma factor [Saccharopolyspora erythraea]